ncbi:MAG: hypothetical protein ABIO55_17920 [Ginsengibacter sp.]
MWIWLTISMVLVVACIIFGVYSFISSRTLHKSISAKPNLKNANIPPQLTRTIIPALQQPDVLSLKIKLKSIEENSLQNVHRLNELQKKVEALESAGNVNEETKWNESDEDWEKLYYETRREKQALEDNLNFVKETLQENKDRVQELEIQITDWAGVKSEMESKVNEIDSLQNIIDELQHEIEGARERERELEQQVYYEKSRYIEYELTQKENIRLRSEVEMLTNSLHQINDQNILLEQKIKRLTELGSILEISEYEKLGIKNTVEQLLQKT